MVTRSWGQGQGGVNSWNTEDFRELKLLIDTVVVGTCYYTFAQTHRKYNTMSDPKGDTYVSV